MGDLRPDNGGVPPEDGNGSHRADLPEFPPEWGTVIIPNDASELDDEAAEVRRELYRDSPRARLRSALSISALGTRAQPTKAQPNTDLEPTSLGVPVVIMAVAILTTLISLFVVTWGRPASPPLPDTGHTNTANETPGVSNSEADLGMASMVLPDATGTAVRLGTILPAVLLVADQCDCATLVRGVAAAVPAGVTVVAVGRTAPDIAAPGTTGPPPNVRSLADPTGLLRARYASAIGAESGVAAAVLVDGAGHVVRHVPRVDVVEDITPIDGL